MSRRISLEEHELHSTSSNLARARKYDATKDERHEAGVPEVPTHLTVDERVVWDRVVAILTARGALTDGDGGVVERYAKLYVRWQNECNALEAEGTLVEKLVKMGKDHLGIYAQVPNPRLKIIQATERQLLNLDVELGLTPRHRTARSTKAPHDLVAEMLAELKGGVQ